MCIDFLTLRTKAIPRLLGPTLSLTLTQSKGWPFQLFAWGMIDLIVLWGERPFVRHWGYWQDFIAMMNKSNPSGSIIFSPFYFRILISSLVLSAMATVKRAILEHTFGKRIVGEYCGTISNSIGNKSNFLIALYVHVKRKSTIDVNLQC